MNLGRKPLFVLDQDCQTLSKQVIREAKAAGISMLRTFDLEDARLSNKGFQCPIHGTMVCTCQLVILLILDHPYGTQTIILEGRDHQTRVYLDAGQGNVEEQVDTVLISILHQAFFLHKLSE